MFLKGYTGTWKVCVCARARVWCVFILKDGFTLCKPSWDTFFSSLHASLMSFHMTLFLWSCLLSAVWTRAGREQSSLVSASGCREHPCRLPMPRGERVSTAESSNTALLFTDMAKCADWCSCPPMAHQVPTSHSQKARCWPLPHSLESSMQTL